MTIHVTVATVVANANRFLVVREHTPNRPHLVVVNQPAGHVESKESLVNAAVRETLEETGWLCRITHCVGIYHYLSPTSKRQYLRTCFAAEIVRQEHPTPRDNTILAAEWMSLSDLVAIHNTDHDHEAQLNQHTASHQDLTASERVNTGGVNATGTPPTRVALRSPVVLDCIRDYLKGQVLPWPCLQETNVDAVPALLNDVQSAS